MDELDIGALAVDVEGVIQAVNRPVRDYLALEGDPRGQALEEVIETHGLAARSGARSTDWRRTGRSASTRWT